MGENMIKLLAGKNKLAQVRSREWLTWLELSGGGSSGQWRDLIGP